MPHPPASAQLMVPIAICSSGVACAPSERAGDASSSPHARDSVCSEVRSTASSQCQGRGLVSRRYWGLLLADELKKTKPHVER